MPYCCNINLSYGCELLHLLASTWAYPGMSNIYWGLRDNRGGRCGCGSHVGIAPLVHLRHFTKDHRAFGLCCVKRYGTLTYKRFQMVVNKNLVAYWCWIRKSRFCLGGMRVLRQLLMCHARSWGMRVCIYWREWLGGVSLMHILFHICKSDQFYPNPTWVIPLQSTSMDVRKAALILKITMNPHDIEMEDISNVFFDVITGA